MRHWELKTVPWLFWLLLIVPPLFILGTPDLSIASHTAVGAFVEDPAITGCNHCHNLTITAGNADGSNRRAAWSPANGSSFDPHVKRNSWGTTVNFMISKGTPSTSAATTYLNTWYATTTSCPAGIPEGQSCAGGGGGGGDTQAPSVPTNVQGTPHPSGTIVTLTWDPSTDNVAVAGYNIYRNLGTTPGGPMVGSSSSTAFIDTGLTPDTDYTYEVDAFDAASNTSAKSSPRTVHTPPAPPPPTAAANFIRHLGGSKNDHSFSISQTTDRGYILAGRTESSGAGLIDVLVVRLDLAGNVLWQKTLGNSGDDYGKDIVQTFDGGFVLVGFTNSMGVGGYDILVVKLDTSGNVVWEYTLGGAGDDRADSIRQTSDGGFVIGGRTTSFGAGGQDALVVKLDSTGSVQWRRTYGGSGDEQVVVNPTSDGGYIAAGFTTSFGAVSNDALVIKLDSAGNVVWDNTYGGTGDDQFKSIVETLDGGFVAVGKTSSSGAGLSDALVVKLDASGNVVWQKTLGGTNDDNAEHVAFSRDGTYVIAGDTLSFGAGARDAFLAKIDDTGNIVWQRTVGGSNGDAAFFASQTAEGGYAFAGQTASYGQGLLDVMVMKLDPNGNIDDPSCTILQNVNVTVSNSFLTTNNVAVSAASQTMTRTNLSGATSTAALVDAGLCFDELNANYLWGTRFNGPANNEDTAQKVVTDSNGNVYVTGWSYNGATFDYRTVKYDPNGNQLCTAFYDNGRGDFAHAIGVDASGNIYVTGRSHTSTGSILFDIATIKYDSNCNQLWVQRYNNGGDDYGLVMAVDASGNSHVTGFSSNGSNNDYITLKYDSSGILLWSARYNNGFSESARDIQIDGSGNVYVTGWSNNSGGTADYATVKYDSNGNQLWVSRYNGPGNNADIAQKVAVDASGNVYVTGWSHNGTNFDVANIKYNSNGSLAWVARYDNGKGDFGHDIGLDKLGNVYVTGRSADAVTGLLDIITMKCDNQGNIVWQKRYDNAGGDDIGLALSVDANGNTITTGISNNGTNNDLIVIKYDFLGNQHWLYTYNNGGGDSGRGIKTDTQGNVYVTGWSHDGGGIRDFITSKLAP